MASPVPLGACFCADSCRRVLNEHENIKAYKHQANRHTAIGAAMRGDLEDEDFKLT